LDKGNRVTCRRRECVCTPLVLGGREAFHLQPETEDWIREIRGYADLDVRSPRTINWSSNQVVGELITLYYQNYAGLGQVEDIETIGVSDASDTPVPFKLATEYLYSIGTATVKEAGREISS